METVVGAGVRKTVTVLFCDLVSSTRLAGDVDPEALREVMSRYFDTMRDVLERHGGTVEKFSGDDVMAVFGVPVAREDDALRAVHAAAEMLEALERLNDELTPGWGLRLQARIGINTGEVVAGDPASRQTFVTGEPVNVAKRLEQSAAPGDIVIGEATYPLVRDAVEVGPVEMFSAKGKSQPVGRLRVEGIEYGARGVARRLDSPMIGREQELRVLRDAFARAVAERSCRVVALLGPPGIGKSRLAAELVASVAHEATAASGRCLPYGKGITYWPLIEVVQTLGGEAKLVEALADDEHRDRILELVRGALGRSVETVRSEETFWAVRRCLEALARRRPLVVVIEDLHWAEPTFIDLLDYVLGWSREVPILFVCLARPELLQMRPEFLAPRANAEAVVLQPLSPEETLELLEQLRQEWDLDDASCARIAGVAEGNPLFVEQIAALAAEGGRSDALSIPPSISALLAERLDRLTAEESAVITRASVIGRDFSAAAVSELSPVEEWPTVQRHLLALMRKELVQPALGGPGMEDRFSFRHVLVRDAAYGLIPKTQRAVLHERLADWVERTRAAGYEEILGYHLEQAHNALRDLRPLDPGTASLAERASSALAAAGRRASARDDVPAALNLLGRAAALAVEQSGERAELDLERASRLHQAGRLDEVEALLDEAEATAALVGDRRLGLRVVIERSFLDTARDPEGRGGSDRQIAESVIPELERLGDDVGLAKAWWLLSEDHLFACRWGARAEALEHALEHARRAGDRRQQATLVGLLCQALLYGPTTVDTAIARCEQFLADASGDSTVEAGTASVLAVLRAMQGDFDVARERWAAASEIYDELGLRYRRAARSLLPAAIELLADDPDAAAAELLDGYQILEAMGERGVRSTLAAFLADALCAAGRYDEAEEFARVSSELAASDDLVTQIVWRSAQAKVLVHRADLERADALAAEAERLAAETDSADLLPMTLLSRAHVARAADRSAEAAALIAEARTLHEQKGNVVAARKAADLLSPPGV